MLFRDCIMTSYVTKIIICWREETKFFPQISKFFARFGTVSRAILFAACAFREIVKPAQKKAVCSCGLKLIYVYLCTVKPYYIVKVKNILENSM